MNCSICGAQMERGKDFCPNCGTKIAEMPGGGKRSGSTFGIHNEKMQASQYQNELNFTKDYNNLGINRKSDSGSGSKVGAVIFIIILLIGAGVFAFYWFMIRPYQTKVFELDGFSIEMPKTMETASAADEVFGSVNSFSQDGLKIIADGYENSDVVFAYIIIDYTDYQEIATGGLTLDSTSAETYLSACETMMKSRSDYKLISSGSDNLKCQYRTADDDLMYMNLTVKKKDKAFYLLAMGCREDDMSKYQSKIDKWMKTVSIS